MQLEPCDNHRPGRATAHDICEFCEWPRGQHPQKASEVVPKAAVEGLTLLDELTSITADRNRYYAMLVEIGAMFGKAACTADNGDLQRGVIVTKVPGLVKALLEVKGYKAAADRLPVPASSKLPESVRGEAAQSSQLSSTNVEQVYDKPKAKRAKKEKDIA